VRDYLLRKNLNLNLSELKIFLDIYFYNKKLSTAVKKILSLILDLEKYKL